MHIHLHIHTCTYINSGLTQACPEYLTLNTGEMYILACMFVRYVVHVFIVHMQYANALHHTTTISYEYCML